MESCNGANLRGFTWACGPGRILTLKTFLCFSKTCGSFSNHFCSRRSFVSRWSFFLTHHWLPRTNPHRKRVLDGWVVQSDRPSVSHHVFSERVLPVSFVEFYPLLCCVCLSRLVRDGCRNWIQLCCEGVFPKARHSNIHQRRRNERCVCRWVVRWQVIGWHWYVLSQSCLWRSRVGSRCLPPAKFLMVFVVVRLLCVLLGHWFPQPAS